MQLAAITGAGQSTVGTWMRGESSPGVIELAILCKHFGVSADYLLGLSDFQSGLSPDSWIVDLDARSALVSGVWVTAWFHK